VLGDSDSVDAARTPDGRVESIVLSSGVTNMASSEGVGVKSVFASGMGSGTLAADEFESSTR
jgi:hypothetical protein